MPRSPSSPKTLNLFEYSPPAPPPAAKLPTPKVRQTSLHELSERALLTLLRDLVGELDRRVRAEPGSMRQDFERSVADALSGLEKLAPKPRRQRAPSKGITASRLHPAKLKAVRTACAAGVAPGQVAKHFGLSLAEVRKALAESE